MGDKPEGSGYVEKSVQDRYDSMKNIPTTGTKHKDQEPIGEKAGAPSGYKPSTGATS